MSINLKGKRIAVLATDGFEQSELERPVIAFLSVGAEVTIVSLKTGHIQGMRHDEKGDPVEVDVTVEAADPTRYDALILPGGVSNPDKLRTNPHAVDFARHFVDAGKPIAAICHGPWTLIETGMVRGKLMTSWPSLKTDLQNAGANWVDREVVRDSLLVTSRKPDDLDAFCREIIALVAETDSPADLAAVD